jgi:hypothetical protein
MPSRIADKLTEEENIEETTCDRQTIIAKTGRQSPMSSNEGWEERGGEVGEREGEGEGRYPSVHPAGCMYKFNYCTHVYLHCQCTSYIQGWQPMAAGKVGIVYLPARYSRRLLDCL